ncbi:hypothetical protein [Devosia nitrariae]|nr:hypothetical protein [Devosia nitrariae]
MRLSSVLITLLASAPAFAQSPPSGPAMIGEMFCIGLVGGDMEAVRSAMTTGLNAAIDAALERNDALQTAQPDEKPPLGDGVPWSGASDYSPQCTPAVASQSADTAEVTVRHTFPDEPVGDYEDTLFLVTVEGRYGETLWRIDDIAYDTGGDIGYEPGFTLRKTLVSTFE